MFSIVIRFGVLIACLLSLASCGRAPSSNTKFYSYNGPRVTWVIVEKAKRQMYLFHGNQVLRTYDIDLGFAPEGNKQFERDGRTPEGVYFIDRRNPNSDFHLSLGISYPNENDIAFAQAYGLQPGGDIFIHGEPNRKGMRRRDRDWTAGCIAVSNDDIEEIYAMVQDGTPIAIQP